MATTRPRATSAPTPAPSAAPEAGPPAKRSLLAVAMDDVSHHMTEMDRLEATVVEVETQYPADHVFAVETKDGYKLADKVRADARKSRLHVAGMRKQGTDLLNALKNKLWGAADPLIERLQAIEDNAKAQVEAQDAKEAARKRKHEDAITAIALLAEGLGGMTSEQIAERMNQCEAIEVTDAYEEYRDRAAAKLQEVRDTLGAAFAATCEREQREAAERAAAAKQDAARARIAYWKALPDQHEESDVEALAAVLATIPPKDDDAEKYGDLAEFVDMARDKALVMLQALHKAAVDTREEAARQARVTITEPVQPVLDSISAEDARAAADRIEEVLDTDLAQPHVASTPAADPDPFSSAAPTPAPVARVARVTRVTSTPAPTPAPSPAPSELSIEAGEPPDLLQAAKALIVAVDASACVLSDDARRAFADLRAAVSFTEEFAD